MTGALLSLLMFAAPPLDRVPCDFWPCPQLYQFRTATVTGETLDLVFFPEGFTRAELPWFRCAARLLLEGVLESRPYGQLACRVNAYYLDLASQSSGIQRAPECGDDTDCNECAADWSAMNELCPEISGTVGSMSIPYWPDRFCPDQSKTFETRVCRNDLCRWAWPSDDGVNEAIDLASKCVPSMDHVIILANSCERGGGGARLGDIGLSVVTTDDIAEDERWQRLAHELGHAFGLLDEYSVSGAAGTVYQCSRNVYSEAPYHEIKCVDAIAWETECSPPPTGTCTLSSQCQAVCGNCSGLNASSAECCSCNTTTAPAVGLFEGAFYHQRAYYRSEDTCRMENYSHSFCQVCQNYVLDVADKAKMYSCVRDRPLDIFIWPRPLLRVRGCPLLEDVTAGPHLCRELVEPAMGFRAVVERDGVRGEVSVREVRATFQGAPPGGRHSLVIRRLASGQLEWTSDGQPIPVSNAVRDVVPGGAAGGDLQFGQIVGDLIVLDERGQQWSAVEVRWTTLGSGSAER